MRDPGPAAHPAHPDTAVPADPTLEGRMPPGREEEPQGPARLSPARRHSEPGPRSPRPVWRPRRRLVDPVVALAACGQEPARLVGSARRLFQSQPRCPRRPRPPPPPPPPPPSPSAPQTPPAIRMGAAAPACSLGKPHVASLRTGSVRVLRPPPRPPRLCACASGLKASGPFSGVFEGATCRSVSVASGLRLLVSAPMPRAPSQRAVCSACVSGPPGLEGVAIPPSLPASETEAYPCIHTPEH
ncbi:hypothetical protein NN561_004145 [Cricetulus griseus]